MKKIPGPSPHAPRRADGAAPSAPVEMEAARLIEGLAWMLAEKTIERVKSQARGVQPRR